MQDESSMYELEYPAPAVQADGARGPVMIVALQGFADAGVAVSGTSDHLKAALETHPLVSFHTDELVDFRSRRPTITINDNAIVHAEELCLDLRVARDTEGTPFLLLSGPEPDMRWNAFTAAVADLAEKYNVSATLCVYGAPMTVPHTRPLVVSAHSSDAALTKDLYTLDSQLVLPGSASLFIEHEMTRRGLPAAGYTAHVPHYVASWPYPQAPYQLLRSLSSVTGLKFPLRSLEHDIDRANAKLDDYLQENPEVAQVVASLEQHYDEELERFREDHPGEVLPGESAIPSGEEIGKEFERFLAEIEDGSDSE
ncbi:PAC2 family protein [Corynebacterium uterequi]|uniref:PAC2 family n=1 Tax=Corynebacterium uterequi TaxID=1072256 RepID=A0A0G3HJI8_9CORY|nr:PAC2 family protein [Corynebacterium uterequi]AKK11277.1 PAC2 family [Corynebacterium uterequi]